MKKDYNKSERIFEEKEKLSRRRTTVHGQCRSTSLPSEVYDESAPLSKKLKVELKDIRQKNLKSQKGESCDIEKKSSSSNEKPLDNVSRHKVQDKLTTKGGEMDSVRSLQAILPSDSIGMSQTGNQIKFSCTKMPSEILTRSELIFIFLQFFDY